MGNKEETPWKKEGVSTNPQFKDGKLNGFGDKSATDYKVPQSKYSIVEPAVPNEKQSESKKRPVQESEKINAIPVILLMVALLTIVLALVAVIFVRKSWNTIKNDEPSEEIVSSTETIDEKKQETIGSSPESDSGYSEEASRESEEFNDITSSIEEDNKQNAFVAEANENQKDDIHEDAANIDYTITNPVEDLIRLAQTRLLTEEDIQDYTSFELSAARNGIFASIGYIFESDEWLRYFENNFEWYHPDPEVKSEDLNDLENKNAGIIRSYEEKKYGGIFSFDDYSGLLSIKDIVYSECSSSLIQGDKEWYANYAYDYLNDTAWISGENGSRHEEYLAFAFPDTHIIYGLEIYSGLQTDDTFYDSFSRPKEIRLEFSDNTSIIASLKDQNSVQMLYFDRPVRTSYISISIISEYPGKRYDNLAVSEVHFYKE